MTAVRTLAEHLATRRELVKLKLWFVWHWLEGHPEESFEYVFRRRTNIWGKTLLSPNGRLPTEADFEDPAWREVFEPIEQAYRDARSSGGAGRFEREAFELLAGTVEAAGRRSYRGGRPEGEAEFGCLRYRPPSPERPRCVSYHIHNPLQPRSILDDPVYVADCFRRLMDDAEARHGADSLMTGTWLNSHPRWLALFPREYLDNMGPEEQDIRGGNGFWGQFLNARGVFNARFGEHFRRTGEMPYRRRTARCSFAAMRARLGRSALQGPFDE
jgi:hypothetical protein